MNRTHLFSFIIVLISLFITSCKEGAQLLPNVSGKAGEVVVVIAKNEWEGDTGATLRSILAADHPLLPQKEPLFTVVSIPESAFSKIFQSHRNLVIVKTDSETEESTIRIRQNIWAAPQVVITISAKNSSELANLIEKDRESIVNTLLMAERNRVIENAKRYEERSIRAELSNYLEGAPHFPKGYSIKKRARNFVWISYETTYTNQGVFIYSFPYRDSLDLKLESLINRRDAVLELNVPGPVDRSFMTTNNMVDPSIYRFKYRDREIWEVRGLWEVENDFMGGPFVSHFFLNRAGDKIIAVEAFVYAPRYNKRNYLRQVESIIYSFDFFN